MPLFIGCAIQALLIVLKLAKVITWSWWLVFTPLWVLIITLVLFVAIFTICGVVASI